MRRSHWIHWLAVSMMAIATALVWLVAIMAAAQALVGIDDRDVLERRLDDEQRATRAKHYSGEIPR